MNPMIDCPMTTTHARCAHLATWRGKVRACYSLTTGTLTLRPRMVPERWIIKALPGTALRLALDFDARVEVLP